MVLVGSSLCGMSALAMRLPPFKTPFFSDIAQCDLRSSQPAPSVVNRPQG